MEIVNQDSAGKEIGVSTPKLSSARSREQKAKPSGRPVDHRLDDVEQGGHPLHLVEEHGSGRCGRDAQLGFQTLGPCDVVAIGFGTGEVERQVWRQRRQQRRLSDLARAEQQDVTPVASQGTLQLSFNHVGKILYILPTTMKSSFVLRIALNLSQVLGLARVAAAHDRECDQRVSAGSSTIRSRQCRSLQVRFWFPKHAQLRRVA